MVLKRLRSGNGGQVAGKLGAVVCFIVLEFSAVLILD